MPSVPDKSAQPGEGTPAGDAQEEQFTTPVRLAQTYLCVPPKLRLGVCSMCYTSASTISLEMHCIAKTCGCKLNVPALVDAGPWLALCFRVTCVHTWLVYILLPLCDTARLRHANAPRWRSVTLASVLRKQCVGKDGEAVGKAIVFMSTCDTVDFYYDVCGLLLCRIMTSSFESLGSRSILFLVSLCVES